MSIVTLTNPPETAADVTLRDIYNYSNTWFDIEPNQAGVLPSHMNEWTHRMSDLMGEIMYYSDAGTVHGYIFSYVKSGDKTDRRHIWLAVTDPKWRRQGVMSALFRALEQKHSGTLTVNTYPRKFPNMPAFLESHEYGQIDTIVGTGADGDKYCYCKTIER